MLLEGIINSYLFSLSSLENGKTECGVQTMIEEMNHIKKLYHTKEPIEKVLRECVCSRKGHQYCISEQAVNEAVDRLMKGECLLSGRKKCPLIDNGQIFDKFNDFEELYSIINQIIGDINGIGALTVYDTAKRIGHIFENPIYPRQYVYLFAGAANGAKNLFSNKALGFREPISMFTPYFGTLPSIFIEDILCVWSNQLNGLNVQQNRTLKTTP